MQSALNHVHDCACTWSTIDGVDEINLNEVESDFIDEMNANQFP